MAVSFVILVFFDCSMFFGVNTDGKSGYVNFDTGYDCRNLEIKEANCIIMVEFRVICVGVEEHIMEHILVIGAHFDDVELGVGGTIARLVSEGKKVYKLTLTDNVTDFRDRNIKIEYEQAARESRKACRVLGITEVTEFCPKPCGYLSYSKEFMQQIEKVIFCLNIDTVFIHFHTDMNQDHVEAARLSMTAARHCRNILQYQSNGYILDNEFYPTYFVDISDFITKKKEALACYDRVHNRMDRLFENCVERNHTWGFANEVAYAEGFRIIKMCI